MKNIYTFCISIILMICFVSLFNIKDVSAQKKNIGWTRITEGDFNIKGKRWIVPDSYEVIKAGFSEIKNNLRNIPFEQSEDARFHPAIIELPLPNGGYNSFYIVEYSMMEPELAAQFPEMKTFTIKGIDDPYATGKIDVTLHGFHAIVLTPRGDYYIDPYSSEERDIYISYFKSRIRPKTTFECLVTEVSGTPLIFNNSDLTGEFLRTYKLACAATGEYTAFHGGTVALGQAAIVTAINRVNAVYERDVSVRMTLVANNTSIVYTNSATDPYTNSSGSTMLGQNQTNLDAVIGTANYNIGHVFSTGGGGIAGLGVVCVSGNKARGVTGSSSPIGDPFYIDYVAHEMGHQFGGNHTFNSVTSNCGGGNRNGSTAWEPGSGSTVMAYAGICGADDLQPNSDDLFHTGSISEIANYTQSGNGNSCPVQTATGNTPPSVTVPSGGFTIPINTPFQLTGSATDINNPTSITYCWEEFDVGPSGSPNSPTGNAPIFRTFKPDTSSTRVFPKISDIVNNTQTIGEILPSYTRSLSFRLTARDNNAGGGGIGFSTITFNVNSGAGPFTVTSPNTNVNWNSSIPQTVTWNVANTNASPVNCSSVNIKLSTDGGYTYPYLLLSATPNDGSQSVSLPGVNTSLARVKVEASGNVFFDISNTNFTISNTNLPSIAHTPVTNQLKSGWPVSVDAVVSSIYPLDSVWVRWYKNSPAPVKSFKLINTSANNYSALFNSLNSDVIVGDIIYYKIFAQNNSAGHENDSTVLYNFQIIDNKLCEGFFSSTFPPSNWSLEYTGTVYWTRNTVSSYGIGTGSAKFDYWNASSGTVQSILTKTFENTLFGDSLKFDHAYAPYTDGSTDSLEILTSTNGGTSFTSLVRLWGNNSGGTLNTRAALGTAYTATSNEWQTKKYSVPAGTNKIKFRARSGFGNNFYIDSICILNNSVPIVSNIFLAQEGFCNSATGILSIRDTATIYLRSNNSPYGKIDSGKAIVDSVTLNCPVTFSNAVSGTYYIQIRHRNSLETWSKLGGESYTRGLSFSYNFTAAQTQAYGSNQILKGTKYCLYSGDVNQDGTIDGNDGVLIDNDAANFYTGYFATDLNGDGAIDGSDAVIANNNAANFVSAVTP